MPASVRNVMAYGLGCHVGGMRTMPASLPYGGFCNLRKRQWSSNSSSSALSYVMRSKTSIEVIAKDQEETGYDMENFVKTGVTTATTMGMTTLLAASPVKAETGNSVDTAVDTVVGIVRSTGDAIKQGLGVAQQGVQVAEETYQKVSPTVDAATSAIAPVVKSTVDAVTPAVQAGAKSATEIITSAGPNLERAVVNAGVDSKFVSTAEKAVTAVAGTTKSLLEYLFTFVTTSSPTVLAETAAGLFVAYFLLPPVLRAAGDSLRGYAGEATPPVVLDALTSKRNCVLVDVRSSRDKEAQGIPDLPNSGKEIELEFAIIEDRKIRGQIRDIGKLETKITAMQIAALKRLNKGTTIYIMDKNGGIAKGIAKELGSRGFKNVYVMSGGFSGWLKDKLGTKMSTTVSRVEVLLPGSQSRGGSASRSSRQLPPAVARKALPSGTK